MLVTLCTIRQLPQAFTLCDSFVNQTTAPDGRPPSVLIGLTDDAAQLPAGFVSPYPLLPVGEMLSPDRLAALSAIYTPTEFTAACKPLFVQEVFRRYAEVDELIYADPNIQFLGALTPIRQRLATATLLLTPHLTRSPGDSRWPDEKFFQNVGLYSADFLAFRRSPETDRLLVWWQDRVTERAFIDFCAGLCTDQIWLMHVPVFFRDVAIVKNPGWHVALWNLPERTLRQDGQNWLVTGPAGENQPLQFVNFRGLLQADEGFFPHQNRLNRARRPDVSALLAAYRNALSRHELHLLERTRPAYGQQPEPVVLRGWRRVTVQSMRAVTRFLDQVPLPVIR